jgi:uncharacterized repeat protein (TIGR02543 family)
MLKKVFVPLFLIFALSANVSGEFDPCKFNFGTDWDYLEANQTGSVATNVDYVTKWIVNAKFTDNAVYGRMVDYCVKNKKTVVYYSYIIAKATALGDADVGGKLNTLGAQWIKSNFNSVKTYYKDFAQATAAKVNPSHLSTIWLLEPDFYQYSASTQTSALSFAQAGDYLGQLIDIIKTELPDAMIAIDISPWIADQGNTQSWYSAMPCSKATFLFTSAGISQAGSSIIKSENKMTWQAASNAAQKGIIADCGYGAGGGSTGHNSAWDDVNNLKSRIADGVVAITQKNPNGSWGNTIATLRTQLASATIKSCSGVTTKFNLTVTTPTGGTITKSPDGASYAKGTEVTLTAKPSTGYEFKNWTGDATGSSSTVKITMDKDKSVGAVFSQIPINSFTVQLSSTGTGTVSKTPDQGYYTSGTKVTITATPADGISAFEGWSGDYTGTEKSASVTVTANMQITAKFRDTLTSDSIKVEAESFTQKSGDAIKVETNGSITSIGYIENGMSTTYQVNISTAGEYQFCFRVASGIQTSSFDVSVDGKSAGSISFAGTNDNSRWNEFKTEVISSSVVLTQGNHTLLLNYKSAINVDYIVLKLTKPIIGVLQGRRVSAASGMQISTIKGGFQAVLPSGHQYDSYSLYDYRGQKFTSGRIRAGMSKLYFDNLTSNVWVLCLESAQGRYAVRAAVVK